MKKFLFSIIFSLAIVCTFTAQDVYAVIFWDWEILNNNITVSPTKTVVTRARLLNTSTEGEVLQGGAFTKDDSVLGAYIDSISQGPATGYFQRFGPECVTCDPFSSDDLDLFFGQFDELLLEPGQNFDFIFGHYIPNPFIPGDPLPGIYNPKLGISLTTIPDGDRLGFMRNTHHWTVSENPSDGDPLVPEPSTILLMGSGLIGLKLLRKRKNKSNE